MRLKKIVGMMAMLYINMGYSYTPDFIAQQFQLFQQQYHKSYASPEIAAYRQNVFANNLAKIQKHNAEHHTYQLAINEYADLTWEEFSATRLLKSGWELHLSTHINGKKFQPVAGISIPLDVDWRSKGAVTPVKNQGECGSGWAFATTGLLEGAGQIQTGSLHSLSEQEFLDCNTTNAACYGGQIDKALTFAQGGVTTEASYPYTARQGACRSFTPVLSVNTFSEVTPNDASAFSAAINQQPIAIGIQANSPTFQFYHSGVFNTQDCGTVLNHAMLVVGYTAEYWIVKNSWGSSWGSQGYIFIARNSASNAGICGIYSYPWAANTA